MNNVKDEALRYLGYKGGALLSDELSALTDNSIALLNDSINPKFIYSCFELTKKNNGIYLNNTAICLKGKSIAMHLEKSNRCVIMAVTLGAGADLLIKKQHLISMTSAAVINACASAMAEYEADKACDEIERKFGYLTPRFSPGYGDLDISLQPEILRLLDTARKIGLTVTDSNILIPSKSITAICGLTDVKNACKNKCNICENRKRCEFRRL